jgi:hypothetical protein
MMMFLRKIRYMAEKGIEFWSPSLKKKKKKTFGLNKAIKACIL